MRGAVVIVALFLATGCDSRLVPAVSVSDALEDAIEHASDGTRIDLAGLADFEWDDFVVLGPYTTREGVDRALGFAWPGFDAWGLELSDSFSLLVFLQGESVVRVDRHRRCVPDFSPEVLGRRIPRSDASFNLVRRGGCSVLTNEPPA